MSMNFGPLQIIFTETNSGTTTTGTIHVKALPPGGPLPNINASVTLNGPVSSAGPQQAAVSEGGDVQATWSAQVTASSVFGVVPLNFTGTFTNNLQGTGKLTTGDPATPGSLSTQDWTAQLGETNVPFTIVGTPVGTTITIAGSQVTFNVTIDGDPDSATATLDPATGMVSSSNFSLGPYTSVGGQFFSNTSGKGSFTPGTGVKRQDDAWGTDTTSK